MNAIVKTEAAQFRDGFTRIVPQLKVTLPSHIPFEKFERICMLAVQRDPDILKTDHRTLFLELQKCAADGLLPDARQAVIVRRWNSKLGKEAATYQPMVAGLRILMRNSGEVASLHAQVVYEGEPFRIVLGDDERIEHERVMECVNDDKIIGAYAVATLKDGEKIREFMTWSEIEKVRNVNKFWAKGPWASWKAEMCRKSVIRRLYKSVPQSTDKHGERLQQAIERDDENTPAEASISALMTIEGDAFESASAGATSAKDGTPADQQTGEIIDTTAETKTEQDPAADLIASYTACETQTDIVATEANTAVQAMFKKLSVEDQKRVNAAKADRLRVLKGSAA